MELSKEVKEILSKYQNEERRVEELLQQKTTTDDDNWKKLSQNKGKSCLSFEEAMKRNKGILKDLEIVKGNLRSKAIYSPSEMQWELICKEYQTTPSLPVTSWRCQISVFV